MDSTGKLKLPLLLDGATGTNLMLRGMPQGVCVEEWVLQHPQVIEEIQREFIEAGSDVIYAPTFSANTAKLSHYGLQDKADEMNRELARLSLQTALKLGGKTLVAGDLSPTGLFCEPFGETKFMDLIDIYARQALSLKEAGVQLLVCETMMSLTDIRAAFLGARQAGLPVLVTITVDERGRTLTGADMLSCLLVMQSLGAAGFGLNCSAGPDKMLEHIRRIMPYAKIPIIAKPNAGVPKAGQEHTYDMAPGQMAEHMRALLQEGVQIIGGCCGTTAAHIAAMRRVLDTFDFSQVHVQPDTLHPIQVANEGEVFFLQEDFELSEPVECSLDMADDLLDAEDEGCSAISVHVSTVDDAYQLGVNCHMAHTPVSILADSAEALEMALLYYNGIAIIDSRSDATRSQMEELSKGYGSPIL